METPKTSRALVLRKAMFPGRPTSQIKFNMPENRTSARTKIEESVGLEEIGDQARFLYGKKWEYKKYI